ncbi:MAG: hypothetical protein ACYCPR_02620 [Thermoplasmataceae archaeon]
MKDRAWSIDQNEPVYVQDSQLGIVRYEIGNPQKKETLERLQVTIIENTVNWSAPV